MIFRCSRKGRHNVWREAILVILACFLFGYLIGLHLREEQTDNELALSLDMSNRQEVKRTSELLEEVKKKAGIPSDYISSLNKTWLTWTSIDSPALYRACVPRPEVDAMREVITGDMVLTKKADSMTIEACIEVCIQLVFTYAALSRGRECHCTEVSAKSPFLTYVDSALCDQPCTGDAEHNCGGEMYMSVYRTAVADPRCTHIELGKRGTFPLIALASFPRSGNTWTRQLIEKATGVYTGSTYWDTERKMEISKKVFLGGNSDYRDRRTICIKTHQFGISHVREFEGAVLLIRNPYRAIVAEAFRRQPSVSQGAPEQAVEYFASSDWATFVNNQIDRWKSMNMQWLQNQKRCLPIIYEELESSTVAQVSDIVVFLNRTLNRERVVCATQEHPSSTQTGVSLGNHGRVTRVYLTRDPFTTSMRKKIDASIRMVNKTLYKRSRKTLPRNYLEIKDLF
ncbi:sialate:O-sulfotransferase 1-like [Diadema antillarum]|uniref:sialate:O-sulfotransferase 1-like n=1 Tax=Diadema antillarum TaxID=105358 RepID=UPI003A8C4CBC